MLASGSAMLRLLALAACLAAPGALAQTAATAQDVDDHTSPRDPDPTDTAMVDLPDALSPAEAAVRDIVQQDGVHVVHFWAPWCDNSTNELAQGWYEVVEAHPEVSFTFVTLWNGDDVGGDVLDRYAIPERVTRLVVPAEQPPKGERRTTFLGLPVTWIPTTWVMNRNGELATAFAYGEVSPDQLTAALEGAASDWPH